MKAISNIVFLALSLALDGTSSSVYAYELRGGAAVLAGTVDNLLPQVLSDVTTDADEAGRCQKCLRDKEYWKDNKSWCNSNGCRYQGDNDGANRSCKQHSCEENKEYFLDHQNCCRTAGWIYDSHGPTSGKHKCEDNWNFWINNKAWCKDHGYKYGGGSSNPTTEQCERWKEYNRKKYDRLCAPLSDFFMNYKDAEIIADILTGVYDDDNFQVKGFQDNDFQVEDFKDDLEESQDE